MSGVWIQRAALFTGFVLLAAGCDLGERTAEAAPAAFENPPKTERDLVEIYLEAHAKNDVAMMLDLVCFDGVRNVARSRESYAIEFRDQFKHSVERAACVPPRAGQREEYEDGGTRMRANLDVIGNLVIEFQPASEHDVATSVSFPVGRKDGVLYLTAAAPVP